MENYRLDFTDLFVNEGEAQCNINYEESGAVDIYMSSKNLADGYYSIYIVNKESVNLNDFVQLELKIDNLNNTPVRLNIAVNTEDFGVLKASDNSFIIAENKNGEYRSLAVQNGCFEIPANFGGTLKVPFLVLDISEDIIKGGLNESYGFGISAVIEENQAVNISVISAILNKDSIEQNLALGVLIAGADSVLNPTVGESMEQYSAEITDIHGNMKNIGYEFFIDNNMNENISITKDGVVTIREGNMADSAVVSVITDNGIRADKKIDIYNSWTQYENTGDGINMAIANVNEVKPVIDSDSIFLNNQFIAGIRLTGILLIIGCIIYYRVMRNKYWRSKRKRS